MSYQFVVLQLLGVDALGVVDGAVDLAHAHALGPEAVQVPHGVEAHVTEALGSRVKQSWGLLIVGLMARSGEIGTVMVTRV